MAVLTPTYTNAEQTANEKLRTSKSFVQATLTTSSIADTWVFRGPDGNAKAVSDWAYKTAGNAYTGVTYVPATSTFTLEGDASGEVFTFYIWFS